MHKIIFYVVKSLPILLAVAMFGLAHPVDAQVIDVDPINACEPQSQEGCKKPASIVKDLIHPPVELN